MTTATTLPLETLPRLDNARPLIDVHRRLAVEPPDAAAAARGTVDGGWMPTSTDLVVELHTILPALTDALGPVDRILYRLDEWSPTPRRLRLVSGTVHLDGYRLQPPHTVCLRTARNDRLVLLVIPAVMTASAAQLTMLDAARLGNVETVPQLLGLSLTDVAPFTDPAVAQQRWDTDGGPVRS